MSALVCCHQPTSELAENPTFTGIARDSKSRPRLALAMQTFTSGREAKEYLIARIVAEAGRESVPLSETERKMMYFTETAWTPPDMGEVSEAFDRDYDQPTYEAKIGGLAQQARHHADEMEEWKEAVLTLGREDHYLLVLLNAQSARSPSRLKDRLKLVGTALLICALMLAGMILFSQKH